MPDEQTQDQGQEGTGQGDGQQGSQTSEELKAEQDRNVELNKRLTDLSRDLKKSQGEAKTHQRRADRLANAMTKPPANPPPQTQGRVRPRQQAQSQQQDEPEGEPSQLEALAEFANENAKEAALLKEVINRGLEMADVEDLEFEDASELALRLDVIQQKKEIEVLKKSIEGREPQPAGEGEPAQTGDTSSTLQIDTGGQSGEVGDPQVQKADALRKQARDLRAEGKYKEATWLSLRASHLDPKKVMPAGPPGEEF